MNKASLPEPLTTAEWLFPRLHETDIVVLDATFFRPRQKRDASSEHQKEHIPGARFFDIDAVADPAAPLPHTLPSAAAFATAVGAMGIGNETMVVVYDSNDFLASARAWWMFRVFGHSRVKVLDGGFFAWKRRGFPVEAGKVEASARHFAARFDPNLVRTFDQMIQLCAGTACQIVDTRSPGRFSGAKPETETGVRCGHIPGSLNVHYEALRDGESHTLRSPPEIAALLRRSGVDDEKPIVATCGSGVSAAILALALYTLCRTDVPVSDGSWAEWGRRADAPLE